MAEAAKRSALGELTKGFVKENPVLRLVLGTCPTLAISTSVENAIGMGIAATLVLIMSNAVISALRKVIPSKVRVPCFIVVIAAFVSMIQLLVKAFEMIKDSRSAIDEVVHDISVLRFSHPEARLHTQCQVDNALDHIHARHMLNQQPLHRTARSRAEFKNGYPFPVC